MEWRDIYCQRCWALPGEPCRTTHGALTSPHTVRIDHAALRVEPMPLPGLRETTATPAA